MGTMDDINNTVRHTGLLREAREKHGAVRCFLGGLDHESVACGNRKREHLQTSVQKKKYTVRKGAEVCKIQNLCFTL